jgi:hypothetical protein
MKRNFEGNKIMSATEYLTMSMHHDAFFANKVSDTTNSSISSPDRFTEERYDRNGAAVEVALLDGDPGMAVNIFDFLIWFSSSEIISPSVFPSLSPNNLPRAATQ